MLIVVADSSVGVLKYSLLPRLVHLPAQEDPIGGDPASRQEWGTLVHLHQLGHDGVLHGYSLLHHAKELPVSAKQVRLG